MDPEMIERRKVPEMRSFQEDGPFLRIFLFFLV
jgi:hypothetical protein